MYKVVDQKTGEVEYFATEGGARRLATREGVQGPIKVTDEEDYQQGIKRLREKQASSGQRTTTFGR